MYAPKCVRGVGFGIEISRLALFVHTVALSQYKRRIQTQFQTNYNYTIRHINLKMVYKRE